MSAINQWHSSRCQDTFRARFVKELPSCLGTSSLTKRPLQVKSHYGMNASFGLVDDETEATTVKQSV